MSTPAETQSPARAHVDLHHVPASSSLVMLVVGGSSRFSSARDDQRGRGQGRRARSRRSRTPAPARPDKDQIVRVLGDDGGAICDEPERARSAGPPCCSLLANGAAGPGPAAGHRRQPGRPGPAADHRGLLPRRAGRTSRSSSTTSRPTTSARRSEPWTCAHRIAELMPPGARRAGRAGRHPVRRRPAPVPARGVRARRAVGARRRSRSSASPTPAWRRPRTAATAVVGSRPCADPDAPDRAALRPLRRAAAARRGRLAHAAVRADRGGRPLVRPRGRRLQGQHRHAPHRPARPRRRRPGRT